MYSLNTTHFKSVRNSNNSNTLTINVTGNIFVFFKLQNCEGCNAFEPVFKKLASEDRRVIYGIVDLTNNNQITQISKTTTTPIQTVPHLILYINGQPFAKFKGQKNLNGIKNFLSEALTLASTQQPREPVQPIPSSFVPQQNMYNNQQYAPQNNNIQQQPTHSSMQKKCESDDGTCLMVPNDVIPYNLPWQSDFNKLTDLI